ncbi:hypothetical protein TSUD_271330 [Trifolium subterraneum]|uniref:Uncharacterized protein n=1 Tax=Trifolium subterraneum TaxID=3900 RepID=A0A2Z6MR62_TRISU|nr:hypothetical protein TSUD_271330 [Trifolium subterraneum]
MSTAKQVITCKAAVCWGAGEAVKMEEIQVEPPKATEVRVKMLGSSVCHTDISSLKGFPHNQFPLALGHEGIGVIESVGDEVTNLKEGDFILPTYIGECGECENCVSEKTNLCLTHPVRLTGLMPDNTSRLSVRGQPLYHVLSCATWSEYVVVDINYLVKVDPTIDLAYASFISCGFSTGYGASWKEADIQRGSTVAVFGLGAVGLGAISGAKMMGASQIIGVDKNVMKKEKGEAFGMTHFIHSNVPDKSASDLVKEFTGRGKAISVGIGVELVVPFGLLGILFGRTLKGSVLGGIKTKTDIATIVNKCQKEEFPLHELHTHEVPFVDIGKAFELLKEPDCVKVVIKM